MAAPANPIAELLFLSIKTGIDAVHEKLPTEGLYHKEL